MTTVPPNPLLFKLKNRLIHGGAWVLGGFLVNAVAGLAVTALLTRILMPADVGLYFLAFSLVITGSGLLQLGMNRSIVRFVAEALTLNEPRRARDTIGKAFLLVAALGLTVALLLNTDAGRKLVFAAFPESEIGKYVLVLSIWLVASALRSLAAEAFRGLHDIKMAALGQRILPNVLLASALVLVLTADSVISVNEVLLLAAGIACVIFLGSAAVLLTRVIRFTGQKSVAYPEILRSSLPLFISQAFVLAMAQAPIWVLGAIRPGDEVANYGTAMRLATFTSVPLLVANNVLMPTVASLHSAGERDRLARVMNVAVTLISLPAIVLFLIYVFLGTELLAVLFGQPYGEAHIILLILSAGLLINVFSGSATVALAMSGHERHVLKSAAGSALISVAGSVALVPGYGAEGAALAASVGMVLYNAQLCWHCQRLLGLRTYVRPASLEEAVRLVTQMFRKPGGKSS